MSNTAFIRKLVIDDLIDTLYFVSGQVPVKNRSKYSTTIEVPCIKVEVFNGRKIHLNDKIYKYSSEVKRDIQRDYAI
jgi:hypothetical protein